MRLRLPALLALASAREPSPARLPHLRSARRAAMAPKLSAATAPSSDTDALRSLRAGRAAASSAAIASLLQGYHTGVMGGALLFLTPEFGLASQPGLVGAIVTATTMGSVLGTASAARLSDGVGRRGTLALASYISLAGSLLLATANDPSRLVLARAVVGVAVGLAGAVVPVYIAETSPAQTRGALAAIPQTLVSTGIFSAYLVCLLVAVALPSAGWRLMMAVSLLPAAAGAMLATLSLPESPRWLLGQGKTDLARVAPARLRGAASERAHAAAAAKLAEMESARLRELAALSARAAGMPRRHSHDHGGAQSSAEEAGEIGPRRVSGPYLSPKHEPQSEPSPPPRSPQISC